MVFHNIGHEGSPFLKICQSVTYSELSFILLTFPTHKEINVHLTLSKTENNDHWNDKVVIILFQISYLYRLLFCPYCSMAWLSIRNVNECPFSLPLQVDEPDTQVVYWVVTFLFLSSIQRDVARICVSDFACYLLLFSDKSWFGLST